MVNTLNDLSDQGNFYPSAVQFTASIKQPGRPAQNARLQPRALIALLSLLVLFGVFVCPAGAQPRPLLVYAAAALLGDTTEPFDVTTPSDALVPVPSDGDWPDNETPWMAIDDNVGTKYLNFRGNTQPTGIRVTPSTPGSIVRGLSFTTANDSPERDPVAYELYGSNTSINGPYTEDNLIHRGEIADFKQAVSWPRDAKNNTPIQFPNNTAYAHYQLLITEVRDPGSANSMQVAEIELLGGPSGGWPPAVDAGDDRIVILPNTTVKLDASVEYFGDYPELLTMQWSIESWPSGVEAEDVVFEPNEFVEDPTVELPPVPGPYILKLYATDGEAESSDLVHIAIVESMCPVGNLNDDCAVNGSDLLIMADNWLVDSGSAGGPLGDLNGKDGVEMTDFTLLAENWKDEGPQVVINEFMALNDSKYPLEAGEILDENGDSSDWIELHNTTGIAISLKGWYLTNDPGDLTGWEFQDVVLEPDEYLVVFASGKDRDDPEGELHTDFNLSGDAGYLALVKPDGITIAHSYDYPQQFPAISYGLAAPGGSTYTDEELISENAQAYALIPQNDSLGTTWIQPGFTPSGWKEGRTGIGYDYPGLVGLDVAEMRYDNRTVYIRIPFEISDLTGLRDLVLQMKYDDGFIAYINGNPRAAGANDPVSPTWNSGAEFGHDDSLAVNFVDFPLPEEHLAELQIGQNVLAIHGLNYLVNSSDLLITPRLTARRYGSSSIGSLAQGFFRDPTPGYSNAGGIANLGPAVRNVTENPIPPNESTNLVISAQVSQTYDPVASVTLHYRIGFGSEAEVAMIDNGVYPDTLSGDGVYAAVIPASAYSAGDMVRWYVTAVDSGSVTTREPMFLDPLASPEYFGTVIFDPGIITAMQVFQYFVQNVSAAGTRTGTRCSVFFLNEFYDNVFIRLRGANTTHGRKFEFNDGHHFRFDPSIPRVDEINLNERGADSTSLRQPLAWETYYNADVPASLSFPLHVRRNGSYLAVRIFVEQPDRDLLRRNDLDPDGALYKLYTDFTHGNISDEQVPRKKTRLDEDLSDLQALADGINPSNPNRFTYMFDNVNIPAIIEYWASTVIIHDNDQTHKNYYGYRDTRDPSNNPNGTNEWMYLPWDKDLTFGVTGIDDDMPGDIRSPSHPFYGCSEHQKIDYKWNGLIDALFDNAVTRQMYLRRLRTLMDDLLQPPGTPAIELKFERRINELKAAAQLELGSTTWNNDVEWIKNTYMVRRRQHLFVNHSIHNPGYDQNAGIPDSQPASPTITIGSIDYNPASWNQDEEYIELVNPNTYAVDITGWKLDDAVEHTFAPGTVIPAGSSMYVTPDAYSFRNRSASPTGGQQRFVQGNYKGHLSSWGETINLYNANDDLVDTLTYPGTPSDAQRYLRITEIMYHPADADTNSPYNDEDFEYIELRNIGETPLSLIGVKFTDGIDYNLPSISLPGGEHLLVVKNIDAFNSRYSAPGGTLIVGPYDGQLSNGGEKISLDDATNSTILEFSYSDGWFDVTDGNGFSLTVRDVNDPNLEQWDSKSGWRTSVYPGGSPGWDDSGLIPLPGTIVINEVLAHSHDEASDWIELYNTTNQTVDIGGWFITDNESNFMKYEIEEGAEIGPYGYFVLYQDPNFGDTNDPGTHEAFALSENGETVILHVGAGGELMGFMDEEKFDASETGVAFGRYQKSTGTYNFVPMESNTPREENAYPKVGPIVITELMYHPPDPCAGDPAEYDDDDFEYIELHNITDYHITLQEYDDNLGIYVPWQIKGVSFTFLPGTTIPAHGYLVVARNPLAFMYRYGSLPAGMLHGPCGKMQNDGEEIQLSKPGDENFDTPEVGDYYMIRVDRVNYSDGSHPVGEDPWPIGPDGWGYSLTRTWPELYGNDPNNWTSQTPSPGG
ncbi:MAG: lamin tail domain-containing protein [Sedimentisphaerales bacterium]|nr:lamin tail domain-containing protein [Sedimentisphaerales bacterium]